MKEYCTILNHFKLVNIYCKITMKVKWTDNMQEAGQSCLKSYLPLMKKGKYQFVQIICGKSFILFHIWTKKLFVHIYSLKDLHEVRNTVLQYMYLNKSCVAHRLDSNHGFEISFYLISPPKWYHDFIKNRTIHQLGTKCRKNPQRYRLHTEFKQFHKNTKIIFNIFGNFL